MTATSHFIDAAQQPRMETAEERGVTMVLRLILRFSGVCLIFAALGLWLAPGGSFAAELLLMKLGVSVFFTMAGLILYSCGVATFEEEEVEEEIYYEE